jgi:cyclic beta-1,2-glucan synthetase
LRAGDKAHELFALLNPINHCRTPAEVERYKVEPYVVAADVYSVAPHVGRGGWTWYTGSAAWMYRAGVEGILGIRRRGHVLLVDPCLPPAWPGFEATVKVAGSICRIEIRAAGNGPDNAPHAELDGVRIAPTSRAASIPIDGRNHQLLMVV